MPNNEPFYRAALEALATDTSICGLLIDLDLAIESYLAKCDEEGELTTSRVREEIKHGLIHVAPLIRGLNAWHDLAQRKDVSPRRDLSDSVAFFREHAGFGYDPTCETPDEGRDRTVRELAATEARYLADQDVFVVWEVDDIDSSSFDDENEPHKLFCALLCVDTDAKPDVVRGYDPRDGIFERPGRVVGSLGAIDFGENGDPSNDPYARVIVAEMYSEFEQQRDSALVRGDN